MHLTTSSSPTKQQRKRQPLIINSVNSSSPVHQHQQEEASIAATLVCRRSWGGGKQVLPTSTTSPRLALPRPFWRGAPLTSNTTTTTTTTQQPSISTVLFLLLSSVLFLLSTHHHMYQHFSSSLHVAPVLLNIPDIVTLAEATIDASRYASELANKTNLFANSTRKLCFMWSGLITDKGHTEAHHLSRISLLDALNTNYGPNTTHNITFVDYVVQNCAASTDYAAQLQSVMNQQCDYFYAAYHDFASPAMLLPYANANPNMIIILAGADAWSPTFPRNFIVAEPLCDREWFLAGYIAGKVARLATPSDPRLGMVIPWLDQQTYAPHAFALGIQRAEPQVYLTVIAAGSWGDADLDEASTLLLLDDKKTDVIASTMNLPTANSEARRLNKFSVGWHYDRRSQFGDTVLVSVLRTFDEVFYNTLQDWMFNISRASFQRFSCELSDVGPGAGTSTISDFNAIKNTINATVDVWGKPLYFQNGSQATSALLDDARTQLGLGFVPNTSLAGPQFRYVTSCPGGTYGSRVLTPVVDLDCLECPADTYATAGSTSCTKCESSETSEAGSTSCKGNFWEMTNILLISFGGFVFICIIIIICAIVYCVSRRRRHAAKKESEEAKRINWVMAAMTKMNTEGTSAAVMVGGNGSNPSGSSGGGAMISIPMSPNYQNNNSISTVHSGFLKKPTPLNNCHGAGMSVVGDDSSDESGSIDSGIPYGGRRDHTVNAENSSFRIRQKGGGGGRSTSRGDAQFFLPSMQIAGAHNGIVFGNNNSEMGAANSTRSSGSQPSSSHNRGRNGSLVQPIEFTPNNNNNASSSTAQRSFEGERIERRDLVLSKHYYVGQPIVVSVGGPQLYKVVLSNGTTISLREEYGVAGSTKSEMERLTRLPSHPNVLDHYCVTYTPETGATCFFQELFSTGQTLKSTIEELDRPLSEFTAKAFVKQLLAGLSFIHNHHIAHRNLQLRNILVSNSGRIKISEFSSAKGVEQGCDQSLTVVASPECTPPELITGKFVLSDEYEQATKGDVWNLGVLVTEVLNRGHGPWPMNCNKVQEIVKFLASDEDPTMPDGISDIVRSFLKACLNRDPSKRWSVAQLEHHPWITGQQVEEGARNSASNTSSSHHEITSSSSITSGSIGKFTLVRDIGHGAFGTVYEAVLTSTGQLIAVKSISYDSRHASASSRLKKVMKEINVMESLEHPNIVQYYFLEKGPLSSHGSQTIYIAMEYVTGGTLRQLMRTSAEILEGVTTSAHDGGGFPKTEDDDDDEIGSGKGLFTGSKLRRMGEREAAYFTAHMLIGLSYLHGKGFIHRDVKPSNCLIHAGTEKYSEAEAKAFLQNCASPYLPKRGGANQSAIELMELIAAASCSADVALQNQQSSSPNQQLQTAPRKQVSANSNRSSSSIPGQTPSVSMGTTSNLVNGGDNTPPSDTPTDPSAIKNSTHQDGSSSQYYTCLTLKLADFGTAVAVQDGLAPGGVVETVSTNMQGTLLYMAPEIIKEEVPSIKADVWSVGASTLELVTGDHPWSHVLSNMSTFALVSLVTSDDAVVLPNDVPMSDELKDFLMLCFDKKPESRPSTTELLQHPWITNTLITPTST